MTTGLDTGREDPLVGFHFKVDIQGKVVGYFTEVSGLGSETEIIEHKVVNEAGVEVVMKVPGRLKWEDITLKRGITSAMDMWEWRALIENGKVDGNRADGTITMYNQALEPKASWTFNNGWPTKITGPSVKADSNEIGVEEMVIAHEYIVRVS